MSNHNRTVLSPAIKSLGGTPNGEVWSVAKTLVSTEVTDVTQAATLLASSNEFVQALAEQAANKPAPKAKKAKGFVGEKIANHVPVEKTETWTKANGEVIACTPKQKAYWTEQRAKAEATVKAETAPVTQAAVSAEAVVKALVAAGVDVDALVESLA